MPVKTILSEQDYINVNFVLLYRKPMIRIMTILLGLLFISSVIVAFTFPGFSFSQAFTPLIIMCVLPLMTYIVARKNYKTNPRVSEAIEYIFEKDNLVIKGESFNSSLSWNKIYKVTQTKNWILIWQNRQMANCIHRRDIRDAEVSELKDLLTMHKVKNNL